MSSVSGFKRLNIFHRRYALPLTGQGIFSLQKSKDMLAKQSKQYADGDTTWWEALLNNADGILSGMAGIVAASNNKQSVTLNHQIQEERKYTNNILYIMLALGVLIVFVLLIRK